MICDVAAGHWADPFETKVRLGSRPVTITRRPVTPQGASSKFSLGLCLRSGCALPSAQAQRKSLILIVAESHLDCRAAPYDLYLWDGTSFVFDTTLAANTILNFGPGGVDQFEVLGIDPLLGVDPANPTAFITALTFEGPGNFTGTMTPVTTDTTAAPEPASLMPLGTALLGFGWVRRRPVRQ